VPAIDRERPGVGRPDSVKVQVSGSRMGYVEPIAGLPIGQTSAACKGYVTQPA